MAKLRSDPAAAPTGCLSMIMAAGCWQALARRPSACHASSSWQGLILVWVIVPYAILGSFDTASAGSVVSVSQRP
jgi:hypothetical protein